MANREEVLYQDFSERLQPRPLWNSQQDGTAVRTLNGYRSKLPVAKVKHRLTKAEDNALGRAISRRQNKRLRGWLPYALR